MYVVQVMLGNLTNWLIVGTPYKTTADRKQATVFDTKEKAQHYLREVVEHYIRLNVPLVTAKVEAK